MKAKIKATGEIINVENLSTIDGYETPCYIDYYNKLIYNENELELKEDK